MDERVRLMTYELVAHELRVSQRTVQNMVRDGKIPHIKIGRATRFHPGDIDQWKLAIRQGVICDN